MTSATYLTRLDLDGRLFLNERHIGWVNLERVAVRHNLSSQWRARTAEGSSLGVYPTRAAAERAVLTQGYI